jgi:hypothetical protein
MITVRYPGPEDEPDDEVNWPDSTLGDDDEEGFDDGPDEPEPLFAEDDGFEDVEIEKEDDEDGDEEED